MIKVYIAGKITGKENYKEDFIKAEAYLVSKGINIIMNPICLPPFGFEHHEYMHVCKAMIDVCDAVFFLKDWEKSQGAEQEYLYALEKDKMILNGEPGIAACWRMF